MGIQVQRVSVRESGGQLPHNTPSGTKYDLVIEATADAGDNTKVYKLLCAIRDLTDSANVLPDAMGKNIDKSLTTVGLAPWKQLGGGGRWELVWVIPVAGPLAGVQDHLFKYSIVLCQVGDLADADGAESELFTIT